MPIIVTKDGKRIRLTDQEIRQGLEKGQWWGFSKDQAPEVALVDPKTGNVFGEKFDPAQIHKALSQGYRFETPEE